MRMPNNKFWVEKEGLNHLLSLGTIKKNSAITQLDNYILENAGIVKNQKRVAEKDFGLIDAIILSIAKQYNFKIVTGNLHFKNKNVIML